MRVNTRNITPNSSAFGENTNGFFEVHNSSARFKRLFHARASNNCLSHIRDTCKTYVKDVDESWFARKIIRRTSNEAT